MQGLGSVKECGNHCCSPSLAHYFMFESILSLCDAEASALTRVMVILNDVTAQREQEMRKWRTRNVAAKETMGPGASLALSAPHSMKQTSWLDMEMLSGRLCRGTLCVRHHYAHCTPDKYIVALTSVEEWHVHVLHRSDENPYSANKT